MSTGIYSGTCHFFLVESSHRELVVAGPAATATIGSRTPRAGEVLVSPATAAAVGPEWLAGERGGAALLALEDPTLPRRLSSTTPPRRPSAGLEPFVPRAPGLPPARGRRGGAPAGDGRFVEVHGRRGAAREGGPEALSEPLASSARPSAG